MADIIPIEKKVVNFNGAELVAVKANNGKIYAGVSWICKGIGFDKNHKDRQVKNIQSDVVLRQGCVKFDAGVFDPHNEVLAIELDFLPLWLAKISITPKMQQEMPWLARSLVEYQLKAKDVLARAFLPNQPKTQAEMLLMYAQQLVEQERRMKQIEEQMEVVKHRLDNIDNINTIGDLQQRLNAMIRLYALQNGLAFSKAWADFRDAFNTAYRTNLTLRMNNYKRTTGKRKITMPEYLSEVGQLEDAIRVADKLLNRGNENVRNLRAN